MKIFFAFIEKLVFIFVIKPAQMKKKTLISSPTAENLRTAIQEFFFVRNDSVKLEAGGSVTRINENTGNREVYLNKKWMEKRGRFSFYKEIA